MAGELPGPLRVECRPGERRRGRAGLGGRARAASSGPEASAPLPGETLRGLEEARADMEWRSATVVENRCGGAAAWRIQGLSQGGTARC